MALTKVNGIVLSGSNMGESDILSSVYTLEEGKEQFVFKGLRKSKRRPRNATEPSSVLRINYYGKENSKFRIASEFDLLENFSNFRNDKVKIFSLCFISEILNRTIPLGIPDERLYRFIYSAFKTLNTTESPLVFTVFFLVHYINAQGLMPDTGECSLCHCATPVSLSVKGSTIQTLCTECNEGESLSEEKAFSVLRLFLMKKFQDLNTGKVEKDTLHELFCAMTDFLEGYFSFQIKSSTFLLNFFREKK